MDKETFFKRLRDFRKKAGFTQIDLADLVSVHETTIRRWESGKGIPRMDEIKKLANALNVTEDELLNGYEKKRPLIILRELQTVYILIFSGDRGILP